MNGNWTAIGYNAGATTSNQVRIGNSNVTSIGGYTNWTNISDGRVKKNIRCNVPGIAFITKLLPITYNLDLDAADRIIQRPEFKNIHGKVVKPRESELISRHAKEQIVYSGFIAQDVEKAARESGYDLSGVDTAKNGQDLYGLRYEEFVVPLIKAVQELNKEKEDLKLRITQLTEQIEKLESN
jgi:hypothetical protein